MQKHKELACQRLEKRTEKVGARGGTRGRGKGGVDKYNQGQLAPGLTAIAIAAPDQVTRRWQRPVHQHINSETPAGFRISLLRLASLPDVLKLSSSPQPSITHSVLQKQTSYVTILRKNTRSAASSAVHPTTLANTCEHGERRPNANIACAQTQPELMMQLSSIHPVPNPANHSHHPIQPASSRSGADGDVAVLCQVSHLWPSNAT